MKLSVECDSCGGRFKVDAKMSGRQGKCPKCGGVIAVPELETVTEEIEPKAEADVEEGHHQETDSALASYDPEAISGKAALFGLAAGVLGAVVWFVVVAVTGYELGLIAWAIGGAVGAGVMAGGGRGVKMAAFAAGMTFVAIFGGKMLAVDAVLDREIDTLIVHATDRDTYEVLRRDAVDFVELGPNPNADSVRAFMVQYDYAEVYSAEDVADSDVDQFMTSSAPALRDMQERKLGYEAWRDEQSDEMKGLIEDEISLMSAVVENLGVMGILFIVLGVGTSWGMVQGTKSRRGRRRAASPADRRTRGARRRRR